jgi:hypothetical protein
MGVVMAETITVRMNRAYGSYRAGEVVEVYTSFGDRLIAWGYATREERRPLIETAAVEPVAEQADVTPRRKGRRGD